MSQEPSLVGGSQYLRPSDEGSEGFRVPWGGATALFGVGVIYAFALAATLVASGILRAAGLSLHLTTTVLVVISPVATLVVSLVWLKTRYTGDLWRVRGPRAPRTRDLGTGLILGIAAFIGQRVIVVIASRIATSAGLEIPPVQETFREIAENPATAPALVLAAVVLAPIAEELLFRGFLFQGLAQRFGFWSSALISAALFSLVHLDWSGGGVLVANVFIIVGILPLGIAFAAIFRAYGLLASIGTHATYNAVGVILLIALRDLLA